MTTFKLQNNNTNNNNDDDHSTITTASDILLHKIKHNKKKDVMKPRRKRITTEQLCLLSELFQQTDTPGHDLREKLAKKLDMTNREVQVWFQNRRAKVNRMRLQQQQHQQQKYPSSHDQWPISSSSSSSSVCSTPSSPPAPPQQQEYHPIYQHYDSNNLSPIDILASAAAYVQQWDAEEQKRKQEPKKHKSWRPWL